MEFEWDENKNQLNIQRHRIDFFDACQIFDYPIIERIDNRRNYGEVRCVALGQLDGVVVHVVYTVRRGVTRIIFVRRGNRYERQIYKAHISG